VLTTLLYAHAFHATYTALYSDEYATLKSAAGQLAQAIGVADSRVLASLPRMQLPYFEHISPEILRDVRQQEQAFEDFRKLLRESQLPCQQVSKILNSNERWNRLKRIVSHQLCVS
jgi:hypothetical protein